MEVSGFAILIIFIITTGVVAITILNAIIYNNIASDPEPNNSISHSSARWYFYFNIVIGFLTFIIWCWCIYKWFNKKSVIDYNSKKLQLDFDYE
jgi:hypothetical protein